MGPTPHGLTTTAEPTTTEPHDGDMHTVAVIETLSGESMSVTSSGGL